jgi:hypothetical protein
VLTLSTFMSTFCVISLAVLCALSAFALLSILRFAFWRRRAFARAGACGGGGSCRNGSCRSGSCRHGSCGGGGRWGRRSRLAAEMFKRRLGVRADQQALIDPAFVDAQASLLSLREAIAATKAPIADVLRAETVDESALAAIFAIHDEALARARREVVSAVKQVHAVLDGDQRKKAADLLASVA